MGLICCKKQRASGKSINDRHVVIFSITELNYTHPKNLTDRRHSFFLKKSIFIVQG
jgi:hypothetical protein